MFDAAAGKDAAIDVGAGALGQGVVGMSGIQQRDDAGGAQHGVIGRIGGDDSSGPHVFGVFGEGGHGRADLAAQLRPHLGEETQAGIGGLHGKIMRPDFQQRRRQAVDGVVLHRPHRMATGIGDFQSVIHGGLFSGIDTQIDAAAFFVDAAPAAFVDGEFGVDQGAVFGHQMTGTIERRAFLAAGQRHFQGAARLEAFALEAHQHIDPDRGLGFVVGGAAAVEIAVFFDEGERIAAPVLAFGFHHIQVRQQQHGLGPGVTARQHRHQATFLRVGGRHNQVQIRLRVSGAA